jgi:hypothetical protein
MEPVPVTDSALVDWVRPLIEARKTAAEAAAYRGVADWSSRKHPSDTAIVMDGAGEIVVYDEGEPTEEQAAHIALNDPRQIIADCERDLTSLDEHAPIEVEPGASRCGRCVEWCDDLTKLPGTHPDFGAVGVAAPLAAPCRTVRILAWGYRHRDPDGYATVAGGWEP